MDGVGDYLREQGEQRIPTDRASAPTPRCASSSAASSARRRSSSSRAERLERAYGEIESALFEGRAEASSSRRVLGLRIVSPEIALGEGLSLVRGEALDDAPPDAVWPPGADEPAVLACLTLTSDPGRPAPLTEARVRFRRLLQRAAAVRPGARRARARSRGSAPARGRGRSATCGTGGRPHGVLEIDAATPRTSCARSSRS